MASKYKTYPVRMFYHYDKHYNSRIWYTDKWDAVVGAERYASINKISEVVIYEVNIPRTLNAEVAMKLLSGRIDSFASYQFHRVHWKPAPEQPKKPKEHSIDPYDLLGMQRPFTKDQLARCFTEAAKKFHPDKGGSTAAMQAVNAAREKIRQAHGW